MGTQRRKSHQERLAMADAVLDPAFQSLVDQGGDTLRGLWRVQKLELVAVPIGQEGKFYEGDCYLHFDKNPNEQHVHFWIGGECSVDEQAVAAIKAVELDNLFGGLPIQHLPLTGRAEIKDKDAANDKAATTEVAKSIDLFKVSDVTGEMKTEQVKEGNLTKDDLDPNDAFLVSAGALGIWVWLGQKATKEERQSVMQLGEKFIRENGLPPQTALTRTFQNGEPEEFKSLFAGGW